MLIQVSLKYEIRGDTCFELIKINNNEEKIKVSLYYKILQLERKEKQCKCKKI